ncbi:MAG: hypothetical protein ACOX7U_03210 [Desulfitobacteriia bacterium]|jgi:hypothetical protein
MARKYKNLTKNIREIKKDLKEVFEYAKESTNKAAHYIKDKTK